MNKTEHNLQSICLTISVQMEFAGYKHGKDSNFYKLLKKARLTIKEAIGEITDE